jgi:hypothetical protein
MDSTGVFSKNCICGYDSNSYCPLFEGDSSVQSMIAAWPALFAYSQSNCHVNDPWSYSCFVNSNSTTFENYINWAVNAALYFDNIWVLRNTPYQCIQHTRLQSYNNLLNEQKFNEEDAELCPIYTCTSYTSEWSSSQCIYYSNNILYSSLTESVKIASCPTNQVCPPENTANSTCQATNTIEGLNPGDYCTSNAQCSSGACILSRCSGTSLGQNCSSVSCNPGLWCDSSNLCQQVYSSGAACLNDNQCDSYSVCSQSKCTKMFSLNLGSIVESSENDGFAPTCKL